MGGLHVVCILSFLVCYCYFGSKDGCNDRRRYSGRDLYGVSSKIRSTTRAWFWNVYDWLNWCYTIGTTISGGYKGRDYLDIVKEINWVYTCLFFRHVRLFHRIMNLATYLPILLAVTSVSSTLVSLWLLLPIYRIPISACKVGNRCSWHSCFCGTVRSGIVDVRHVFRIGSKQMRYPFWYTWGGTLVSKIYICCHLFSVCILSPVSFCCEKLPLWAPCF